ncbi:MAG: hypothetical protein M3O46_12185 [Myxococcota bacterium]|nr:hypothetical protein [Myxococcota bacterium]
MAAALSALCAGMGVGMFACFDLFHSTRDVLTACEIDGQTPSCGPKDATTSPQLDAASDFCTWPEAYARNRAQHACAWLGACETPTGRNAFGACLFQALLAYDCAANPSHRVKGKAHDLWDCLSQVKSCGDVERCLFPQGAPACASAGNFTSCGNTPGGVAANADVRFECIGDGAPPSPTAHGENCALWGQTCAASGASTVCAGEVAGCDVSGCFGAARTELHWCDDGGDIGIDCEGNGRQMCGAFPERNAAWVACLPEGDGGVCAADASATCANGVAYSCPAGVIETIDCARLLESDAACTDGVLNPHFNWSSPCAVVRSACTIDSCTDAGALTGCVRGATWTLDCATESLGACRTTRTASYPGAGAACAPR